MDDRQLATVLAALRLYEAASPMERAGVSSIATDFGRIKAIKPSEIDALCQSLNAPQPPEPEVVLVIQGGVLQDILSNRGAKCAVIDYDVEGADARLRGSIPQGPGKSAEASCFSMAPEVDPARVKELMAVVGKVEQRSAKAQRSAGPSM